MELTQEHITEALRHLNDGLHLHITGSPSRGDAWWQQEGRPAIRFDVPRRRAVLLAQHFSDRFVLTGTVSEQILTSEPVDRADSTPTVYLTDPFYTVPEIAEMADTSIAEAQRCICESHNLSLEWKTISDKLRLVVYAQAPLVGVLYSEWGVEAVLANSYHEQTRGPHEEAIAPPPFHRSTAYHYTHAREQL